MPFLWMIVFYPKGCNEKNAKEKNGMKKKKTIIEWILGLCVILGIVGVFFLARDFGYTAYANEPMGTREEHAIELEVKEGSSFLTVAKQLKEEDMISSTAAFCFRAKFSSYDGLLKAGVYHINETMGTDDILSVITQTGK